MENTVKVESEEHNSLTSFNIIVEGDDEGLISKIFSKFKTAVSGPQQIPTSPSGKAISLVLSNDSNLEATTSQENLTTSEVTPINKEIILDEKNKNPVIIKTPTSSSSKSTIKHIVIDEDQNQEQQAIMIPLTKTSSIDSDTQSVMTTFSVSNTNSLGKLLNRLRGGKQVDSNKDFWMPDEQCRECFGCNAPFNLFRRKHHCRTCGRIFCSKCLANSIHTNQVLRVCNDCYIKYENYKDNDTVSIQDSYGYSSSIMELTPESNNSKQLLQQRTYHLPNNNEDEENSSDDEFERSTNSLEIQRPNIDLHFSQSTSSHHTTNDNDVGNIKKLLTTTFLRTTPRSRTSTMNSLGIDTSLAILENKNQQQLNSPMPFRRNSFITNNNNNNNQPSILQQNQTTPTTTTTTVSNNNQHEFYETNEDDDLRRWDKNPRNLLNFLGGERPASGIFNNFFFEDYPESPTLLNTPVTSLSTSTSTKQPSAKFMRPQERSNSIIRRRLSLTENNSNDLNNNNNSNTTTNATTARHIRVRTKSLMRNTPVTASIMMDNATNQGSSSGNESGSEPLRQQQLQQQQRCATPDMELLRTQILNVSTTVATHEQWDETSIYLMRNILRHLLVECGVATQDHQAWEDMTMKLMLKIADEVQPHIRVKDDFNMNHYVKIKKVPGGLPQDSFSVSGVAMSKSVVHKDMIRQVENPSILILNFDLDGFNSISNSTSTVTTYNNNGNENTGGPRQEYLKFDRLLAWERDHMNALVDQIIGLKPSIVLIAANVSRTVIERLNKYKIIVAYNIKKQKLDAIARCADATVFNYKKDLWNAKSVPAGRCGLFETLTIMHEYLPNRRKTFLMFQQCPKERGATVMLRGGDLNTLYIIKSIMKFMITVVNNINLEAQLRKDFIELRRWTLPVYDDISFDEEENELGNSNEDDSSTLLQYSRSSHNGNRGGGPTTSSSFIDAASVDKMDAQSISALSVAESQITVNTTDVNAAKKKAQQQFHQDTVIVEEDDICLTAINRVLKQYQNTILSISPGVTLPVPHILLKLRDAQKKLIGLIRERLGASITGDTLATFPIDTTPTTPIQDPSNEKIKYVPPVIPPIPTDLMSMPFYLKAFDVYLEHDLEYRHYQDLHLQAWYVFKKYIDGIHQSLSPIYHQQILVHRTINPMNNHAIPCEKAVLESYNYYDPTGDNTLGQYILRAVNEAYNKCSNKMCDVQLIQHDKTYSHGNAQIKIQVIYEDDNDEEIMEERIDISREEYLRKIPIFIRTKCHICKIIHSWKPMSDLLQRYSFGKFLELYFYQSEPIPIFNDSDSYQKSEYVQGEEEEDGDDGCHHGLYRDHTISFRIQNLSVNFTHAMVKVVEVHPPPLHLRFSLKQQMAIKDASLDSTRSKIARFFDSIIERNKAFSFDIVQPNMIDLCKENLQEMSQEALKNKKNLLQKLQSEYATSAPTDTLQLNNVLAELQNHTINWDLKYLEFARRFVRPERELRRLTTNHLRKMFPAENLYTSNTNSTPIVSNLNLRTKRAIEAADLPLLDVGLDTSAEVAPYGVSGSSSSFIEDTFLTDVTLKEQPGLGESPTESYPWFDEVKRFDQMFMQDEQDQDNSSTFSTSYDSKHHHQHGRKKKHNTADDENMTNSAATTPGQLSIALNETDELQHLDPSVARRLSLELMKDAPKKKKEQEGKQRYLEKSHISELKQSPSPPPPSPMTSSAAFIVPPSVVKPTTQVVKTREDQLDEQNSRLIHQATTLPMLSSTAYKRLAGLLPDPMVGKSKSSPSPSQKNQKQQAANKPVLPYQKILDANKQQKVNNRKSQFYEPSSNLLDDSITTATTTPQPSTKPSFYRGSPYTAAKIQDRSSIAYRYGFMGPPSTNSPPILPVMDKKLGIHAHAKNPLGLGNNNNALVVDHKFTPATEEVVRPRSRTMAIVGGASTGNLLSYQQNMKAATNRMGGRIPIPSSNFTAEKPSIKFSNHIGINASSSQSHLPIPISYHHGKKLSEGKIRHIRQRLPSKASLEPYTKIKEIIANHDESSSSSEDESMSDDDHEAISDDESSSEGEEDGDELFAFQHKTFSLMYTDEYDESLGRDMVPSILELQQFNREHQVQLERNTLPYLSVESGMVGENSRKTTHDEASLTDVDKTLSSNAIMEAVLRSSNNLGNGASSTRLEWSNGATGKNSIMKAITYVLAEKSISNLLPLEYPFSPTEHIFGDSNILVREDEPSSIISYMLGSTVFNEKLNRKREQRMSKATDMLAEKEKSEDQPETKPFFSEMFPETDERERPWKFSFKGGSTNFTCKIYFAEQFDMLRKSCGCDEIFISSLARCTTWDASGGKSGSIFLKTKDERFLIKQISKYEMDAFLGSAHKYFLYMFNEVFDKGIPTVLCKIFGLYRIGFYNNVSGKSMKLDILVMENLFYETSVKKVYDLKGSMRNRYAEKTGKDIEVFLDENLVEIISKTPLYMRVDTKINLSDSLFNDTHFLLDLDVMDYSLLVGFDEETNEIVVGIVDFIRTFTWDKKLESWVKETGMLGGGKKDPTIVSPKMYRKRFILAIDLYFCMIPDFWTLI